MVKHNYSQYSNKKKAKNPDAPVDKVKMEDEPVVIMGPIVTSPVVEPKVETVEGVVVNCAKLNVRTEPSIDGDVVCVLDVTSEIEINLDKSTREWFNICTASGVEGYCMRKFVDACL